MTAIRTALLGACLALLGTLLLAVGPAAAYQYTPHALSSSFNGSDSTGGGFANAIASVAVDQQSGSVYVATSDSGIKLFKFNANGVASAFTDPELAGSTVIHVGATETCSCAPPKIAVDNSGGPTQGRIYVANNFVDSHIWAYEPNGEEVGGNFPLQTGPNDVAVEPGTGDLWASDVHLIGHLSKFTPEGVETSTDVDLGEFEVGFGPYGLDLDAQGNIYTYPTGIGAAKFSPTGELLYKLPGVSFEFAVDQVTGSLFAPTFEHALEFDSFGDTLPGFSFSGSPNDIAVNGVNGRVYVSFANSVQIFAPGAPVTLPDVRTEQPLNIDPTSVTLNGVVNPSGLNTTSCRFEYGSSSNYGTILPCAQGQALSGSADTPVSADVSGLRQGATYHYRLVSGNGNGQLKTIDATFTPSAPPVAGGLFVSDVHSDSALVHGSLNPEGAPTSYHIDYGTENCLANPGACTSTAETGNIGGGLSSTPQSAELEGLQAGTTYHYVLVATNQSGTTKSADFTFTTFPFTAVLQDPCPNAHVRQQTGGVLLADCRAYELVSAANAGGYDVESYLVSGQTPFGGYPRAEGPSRVLYGVHDGAIPGTNHPTNNGLDPYVATRGADGWSTSYVGIPADLPFSNSFASTLDAADAGLDTFTFGGPEICSPCFADGSTGVPVRLADGSLVQGMTGPLDPGTSANAAILVKKRLSDDGSHLVFGSTSQFVGGAGSPAIYDRDLATGVTNDVSRMPDGSPIPCLMQCSSDGVAELDISADGSRIVIGQLVAVDAAGNHYWHLYMTVGDAAHSIDLMPGATSGALFDGMTADGSIAYLTSSDQLTGDDGDTSADVYGADVGGSSATLTRVSTGSGGAGDSDSCEPFGNSANAQWNAVAGTEGQCGAVAIGGGGGVASDSGTIYFLSPELLDGAGNGTANAPNLYLAEPGSAPHFVATLESSATGPQPPVEFHRFSHSFGAGQSPQFVAVDASGGPSEGDIYVADNSSNVVRKFDPAGNLITSWGVNGVLNGSTSGSGPFASISGLAVGSDGILYVATFVELNGNPDLFKFDQNGSYLSSGSLEEAVSPIGIAVDSLGRVYYDGFYNETVYRWQEGSGSTSISTWVYESGQKSGIAVDPNSGDLYVNFGGESIARFTFDSSGNVIQGNGSACPGNCDPTEEFAASEVSGAKGLAVDPANGDLYVDEGNRILRFDADGQRAPGPDTGAAELSNSSSVTIGGDGSLYANNSTPSGSNIAAFAPLGLAPEPSTDNPAVVDAVNDSGTRHTADFEVTPSGGFAAFSAAIPFTGYDNNGHSEIARYDATADALACVSCNPTNARATGNARMAADGLSLTDDGRVFFNSTDALAPRDLDEKEDAYEWEDGRVSLISTGTSHFDSALLSASADGSDAYFFTRDTLVPQDQNRELVKIYDAREEGGFPSLPPPVPCKASDECHGAGTESPPPANVNSNAGTSGNLGGQAAKREAKCKRGTVRRHKRCVRKHHRSQKRGRR